MMRRYITGTFDTAAVIRVESTVPGVTRGARDHFPSKVPGLGGGLEVSADSPEGTTRLPPVTASFNAAV